MRRLIGLLVVTLVAGCATYGSVEAPSQVGAIMPNKAGIYVYRLPSLGAIDPGGTVSVDCGAYPVTLGREEYHEFIVNPGDYNCSIHTEGYLQVLTTKGAAAPPVTVHAEAGRSYYVKAVVAGNFAAVKVDYAAIDPTIAQDEIKHCKEN